LAPHVVVREATAADLVAVSARLGVLVTGGRRGGVLPQAAPTPGAGGLPPDAPIPTEDVLPPDAPMPRQAAPDSPAADSARPAAPVAAAAPGTPHPASQKVVRWVAVAGGRVAGFVELVIRGAGSGPWAGAWLHSLMVWTPYRGLGVGEALTRAVLERARREGAEYVLLAVYADNGPALGLYRKLGFAPATLPELVPLLAKEAAETGRRRVTLRATLGPREGGESSCG
jgi:GNAT superfamily N-acetyltransferase